MEKLKNLVNPGSKKDDEVMYGFGQSDDPVHIGNPHMDSNNPGYGQASHLGSNPTTEHESLSSSSNNTGLSQHPRDITTGQSQYHPATAPGASHGLREPYASRMPGGFDNDDAATTASVSSGIPGQSQSRSAKSSANDATFTEKPLPREPGSGVEVGHGLSNLSGNSYPDRGVEKGSRHEDLSSSSHHSRDAALGAGAATTRAHVHEESKRGNYTPETGRSFPLGGSSTSDKYGSVTADTHSSKLANKVDPRVDNDGSHTAGGTGYGSTSNGSGPTTAGPHLSNFTNKAEPRVDSDNSRTTGNTGYGPCSGEHRSDTAGTLSPGSQGPSGHATGVGAEAVGSEMPRIAGHGPESWQHEHQHHGHQYDGDPCEIGAVDALEGPHFVHGPHVTDTANRLDPHIGSGFGSAGTTGDSSSHHHHSDHVHQGKEAALTDRAGAAGLGALHHVKVTSGNTTSSGLGPSDTDRRGISAAEGGSYDDNRGTTTGVSSTGQTAGPHRSDMLNKLDPRVDSDLSKQQDSRSIDHHYGHDAALTGAGGAELYEAEKHRHGDNPDLKTSGTTTSMSGQSPYGSGVDAMDARSGMARDDSAISSAGSGRQPATASDHHYKREAGLVGAGGIGTSEAGKRLLSSDHSNLAVTPQDRLAGSGHEPAIGATSSPDPSSSYSSGGQSHTGARSERGHLAADVVGTGATGEGDEAQKTRGYSRTELETQGREHQHPGAPTAAYPAPHHNSNSEIEHHSSHHTGRDAALAEDAAAGTGALAGHEQSQRHAAGYGNEPYHNDMPSNHGGKDAAIGGRIGTDSGPHDETQRGHHIGKNIGAGAGVGAGAGTLANHERSQRDLGGYDAEPYRSTLHEHHPGRDAAILGGAAGAGGLAEHEYSKKDAAKLQKEHDKEEKALEKQHLKENKHHDKELAKEEKAHEKAIEKSEKKHEKAMEKDARKHEKAIERDETKQEHGGKKHGGLLGFLHRDKSDKELKEEEAHRRLATHHARSEEGEMAAGAGATGAETRREYDPLQEEHGSQSGVHDHHIQVRSGPTTHDAYGAHDSGHNKLHKDPPSQVIESRGYEFK